MTFPSDPTGGQHPADQPPAAGPNPAGPPVPGAPGTPSAGMPKPVMYGVVALIVLALVCVCTGPTATQWVNHYEADGGANIPRGNATTTVPRLKGTPFVSASPEPATPKLRDVKPVSVVGPTWQKGDKTYTFAFKGVPFAFRGGEHWGCLSGAWEDEDGNEIEGHGWRCIDEQAGKGRPQVDILIRRCDGECDQREQRKLDTDWTDHDVDYQRRDATTRYDEGTRDGKYTLVVSHFFPERPGQKLSWQVAVECEGLPVHKTVIQKVVNDIRTQSGG